jgi:hypothetical protein
MKTLVFAAVLGLFISSSSARADWRQDVVKTSEKIKDLATAKPAEVPCPADEPMRIAPTKYGQCVEKMPENFESYSTEACTKAKVQKGRDCLLFVEKAEASELKNTDPRRYAYYDQGMQINDNGDSQACIRYTNGVLKRPKIKFLERTRQISSYIQQIAKYYSISPEAIVCAIGGDATVTARLYPQQDSYYNPMLQGGPVQLASQDLKSWNIPLDHPPAPAAGSGLSMKEVQSIQNAALILRHAHEAYQRAGFTADDLPTEVLVSIYHLGVYRGGEHRNAAEAKKASGGKPGLSFLGLSCLANSAIYKDSLK